MKTVAAALAIASLVAASAARADATADLLKKSGCMACHAIDKKIVGPAFLEVAAKYKGDAGAAARLAEKVKAGGASAWGPVPMPPNGFVSDADIKMLVGYILALNK